ncbi:PREDICTED: uncharacterized protein LOC106792530 [Polistes canadensis]|uniref:uncharacterized protein LOC106792530 n=1 Tax=Polistes canadensis TaxID=91411 RepID=UPI000718E758|nr:PREDICTED: uncharacterized protein LOC106792530 [Polistes canadensis]
MSRQIREEPEHQDYQRIIWSPDAASEPVEFRLNTVTYGTACATYLAIRTLSQLVRDEGSRYPLGSWCLESETYVDDTFADSARPGVEKHIESDQTVETLGVRCVPEQDEFRFDAASVADLAAAHTKRSVFSNIARLFDPLGWLSPVTVVAKILMQDMWLLKCDWDSPLPSELRERWYEYCQSLVTLPSLSVGRWLGGTSNSSYQIHGFSDASSHAYAAVVYLRIDKGDGKFQVSLLASKSKVAPVKTVSIPNLELCGAALLVRLIRHLTSLDFLQKRPIFAWSDSQIELTWLRKHPFHWKTFVANRVSLIQTQLPSASLSHVPSKENPADLASRGVAPKELAKSALWWHGPSWLTRPPVQWLRSIETAAHRPVAERSLVIGSSSHFLTSAEISDARILFIRIAQATAFSTEIGLLKAGKRLPKGNRLSTLNPFMSEGDCLLRVGGRLTRSHLAFDRKHPPVLPQHSHLSRLFVRHAHHQCLHGGPALTLVYLMSQVWVLDRNRLIKSGIRACMPCQRTKPQLAHQLMGELPVDRVVGSRAFANSGHDYEGPVQVRMSKGRGNRSGKGYIALFVCFATRAIHLELVSDLTLESLCKPSVHRKTEYLPVSL